MFLNKLYDMPHSIQLHSISYNFIDKSFELKIKKNNNLLFFHC